MPRKSAQKPPNSSKKFGGLFFSSYLCTVNQTKQRLAGGAFVCWSTDEHKNHAVRRMTTDTLLITMRTIQVFHHEQFGEIRTMTMPDGQVGFVGKDVAEVLGYSKPQNAIAMHVDKDDTLKWGITDSLGRMQKTTFINESGLYALILSSKLPKAREFKHWVTSEVLPQIRKTGGYINVDENDDDNTIMAKALLVAQKTIAQKVAQIEAQRPKVMFAEAVTACEDSILIRDLAKLITQNGVKIGQGRLFYWLRLHGYIFQRETRPIQKWVEKGYFRVCVRTYTDVYGRTRTSSTTKITGRGAEYFINHFVAAA